MVAVAGPDGTRQYNLWDPHCFYDRYNTVVFDPSYPAGARVTIRLTDRAVDYTTCRRSLGDVTTIEKRLKIIGFMVRRNG